MSIKLIALDLDGTLLTSKKQLSPGTVKALNACIQTGIEVVLATGRMGAGIQDVLKSIDRIRYVIGANGAAVEDLYEGKMLHRQCIPKEDILKILNIVKSYPLMYDVHIDGLGKTENHFLENLGEYVADEEIRILIRQTRAGIPDLRSFIENGSSDIDKCNLTFKDEETRKLVRRELSAIDSITITSSLPGNLELNHRLATKGNGLAFLTGYLHLEREETMAFGDAENDLSMLLQAGTGVAMGNAFESVKAHADYVTLSNDEDGIAAAIGIMIGSTSIQAL